MLLSLVVLVQRPQADLSCQDEIARGFKVQEVPVVDLKAVVCALPEIGLGIGRDAQARALAIDVPAGGLGLLAQRGVEQRFAEVFVQVDVRHGLRPDGVRWLAGKPVRRCRRIPYRVEQARGHTAAVG